MTLDLEADLNQQTRQNWRVTDRTDPLSDICFQQDNTSYQKSQITSKRFLE